MADFVRAGGNAANRLMFCYAALRADLWKIAMLPNRHVIVGVLILLAAGLPDSVAAQQQPPGNNGNQGGILIDAEGVLRSARVTGSDGRPQKPRRGADSAEELRCVSLRRLGERLREAGGSSSTLPADLQTLGGLTAIDEVILNVADHDVLLIGPGEAAAEAGENVWIGATTGRPLIRTEDWLVVLRSISQGTGTISCSIDPDRERLKEYDAQIRQTVARVTLASAPKWYAQLAKVLGRQPISIQGVPVNSRVAMVLASADYSMKQIALGTMPSGVKEVKSQLALAGSDRGAVMQRWWFAPLYEPIEVDADRTRFRMSGPRVQLCAQEELVTAEGGRRNAATTRLSSLKFAQQFTEHYEEVADRRSVFAELRQLFDLSVAATILIRERFPERAGWDPGVWLSAEVLSTEEHPVARYVESESTTRRVNSSTIVGLVGGVTLEPGSILKSERPLTSESPQTVPPNDVEERGGFVWKLSR